jgi:hypothetical protein
VSSDDGTKEELLKETSPQQEKRERGHPTRKETI